MQLPSFETRDMHDAAVTDATLRAMAPMLVVLLRGFA